MAEDDNLPTRDDYYRISIERGADEETAAKIADGLMGVRERRNLDLPGWENLCHRIPRLLRSRSVHLYSAAAISCPSDSVEEQARSGLQSVLCYGVFLGMALAENGHLMSEAERKASRQSMPDVWKWIELLNDEQKSANRPYDD